MSALGQKQTCAVEERMSALPPIATAKADIGKPSCLKRTCPVHAPMSAKAQKRDIRTDESILRGAFNTHIDLVAKRPEIDWLGEKRIGTVLQGLLLCIRIPIGGNHDDRYIGSKGLGFRQ